MEFNNHHDNLMNFLDKTFIAFLIGFSILFNNIHIKTSLNLIMLGMIMLFIKNFKKFKIDKLETEFMIYFFDFIMFSFNISLMEEYNLCFPFYCLLLFLLILANRSNSNKKGLLKRFTTQSYEYFIHINITFKFFLVYCFVCSQNDILFEVINNFVNFSIYIEMKKYFEENNSDESIIIQVPNDIIKLPNLSANNKQSNVAYTKHSIYFSILKEKNYLNSMFNVDDRIFSNKSSNIRIESEKKIPVISPLKISNKLKSFDSPTVLSSELNLLTTENFQNIVNSLPIGILILKYQNKTRLYDLMYTNRTCLSIFSLNEGICFDEYEHTFSKYSTNDNFPNISNFSFYDFVCNSTNSDSQRKFSFGDKEIIAKKSKHKLKVKDQYLVVSVQDFIDYKAFITNDILKNIKTQHLLSISHELNNPLVGLISTTDELINENITVKRLAVLKMRLKCALDQVKFYIKNYILSIELVLNFGLKKVNLTPFSLYYALDKVQKKMNLFYKTKNFTILSRNNQENLEGVNIITDFELFKLLLKNIYMYIFHYFVKHKFDLLLIESSNKKKNVNISFFFKKIINKKASYQEITNFVNPLQKITKSKEDSFYKLNETMSSLNMLKDIIDSLSKKLNFKVSVREKEVEISVAISDFKDSSLDCTNVNEYSPYESPLRYKSPNRNNRRESTDLTNVFTDLLENDYYTKLRTGTQKLGNKTNINVEQLDTRPKNKINSVTIKNYHTKLEKSNIIHSYAINHPYIQEKENNQNPVVVTTKRSTKILEETFFSVCTQNEIKRKIIDKVKDDDIELTRGKSLFFNNYKNINLDKQFYVDNQEISPENKNNIYNMKYNRMQQVVQECNEEYEKPTTLKSIMKDELNRKLGNYYVKDSEINCKKTTYQTTEIRGLRSSPNVTRAANEKCDCANVLIVDDEKLIVDSFKMIFKNSHQVHLDSCSDGKECIDKINLKLKNNCCKYYKIILMDYMMPIMNGIQASILIQEKIRNNEIEPLIIIMITAHDSDQMQDKIKEIKIIKKL